VSQPPSTGLLRLIRNPPEALLAPKHCKHVENAGRGRAAGERRAQGLGDAAKLCAFLFRIGADDGLRARGRPVGERGDARQQVFEMEAPGASENLFGRVANRNL
jgi:hypothetical protein